MNRREYIIDGNNFSNLEEFYDEISKVLVPGAWWGRNLDAFDDILSGDFGTPKEGFILKWNNASVSKDYLGYPETIRQLEKQLLKSHPANRQIIQTQIDLAKQNRGLTIFDKIIKIIEDHKDIQLILN
ncbi:MAG: barstar family protein [Acidobacteriota bacterium]|nr:barstar family protein [Acidobacteriota bacterium]